MVIISPISPIDFLVSRKFPGVPKKFVAPFPSVNRGHLGGSTSDWRKAEFESAQRYRAELEALPADELKHQYEEEQSKWHAENNARLEREERDRSFNQPNTNADFEYWSRMPHWALDEAIALSFGKAPEHVSWKTVEPHVSASPFAVRYARLREIASRALVWQQLFDPIMPSLFIAWIDKMELQFPVELKELALARGQRLQDWSKLYSELKEATDKIIAGWQEIATQKAATIAEVAGQRDSALARAASLETQISGLRGEIEKTRVGLTEKTPGVRERDSLLKLVIGMAVGGYSYDPSARRSDITKEIADDLERAGVALDVDTVRKYLRAAAEHLPSA